MKQENATKMTMLVIFAFLLSIGNVAAQADGVTFDFEDGDQGWRLLEGNASKFRVPVSKVDRSARIPATGKYVLAATGILESPVFRIDDSKAAFYVGGAAFLLAVSWTVFRTREYPPEQLAELRRQ